MTSLRTVIVHMENSRLHSLWNFARHVFLALLKTFTARSSDTRGEEPLQLPEHENQTLFLEKQISHFIPHNVFLLLYA